MPFGYKDILSKEVLIWKHIQSELVKDYKQLLQRLLDIGYEIKDGSALKADPQTKSHHPSLPDLVFSDASLNFPESVNH